MITPKDPMWVPVRREILDRIVRGVYPEGSALPSERDLCKEFDVSGAVLRESVKALTQKGLVTTWRGRGTIAEPAGRWRTVDPDLLAAMAAVHADNEQRAALQQSFEELERWKHDPSAYVFADGHFHNVIVRISGVSLARDLLALMAEPFNLAREGTALIPGGLERAHLQHRLVYECVMAGDGPGANAAIYEHLESAEERLNQLRWAEHGLVLR